MGKLSTPAVMVAVILSFALGSAAGAGPPTEQVRDGIRRIVEVVDDPALRGDARVEQRKTAVNRIAGELFDFEEMSKRTLGRHWAQRTPAERLEFARLFTGLIQRSYFSKVDEHGSGKTVFGSETVDGGYAVVRTTVLLAHGATMPLDYSMHKPGDRWRVYDLSIDGVSLTANYRSQFNRIIRTSSFAALVTRMRSHETEVFAPSASPSAPTPTR